MTESDISELREKISRCRRLLRDAVDPHTQDALQTLLTELERELREREASQ